MSVVRFFSSILGSLFARSNVFDSNNYLSGAPVRRYYYGSSSGFYSGAGYPGLLYNQQSIEQYLAVMDMLSEVFMFSITGLVVRHIADAVIESMRENLSITVNLSDDESKNNKYVDELYSYMDKIDYKNLLSRILPEYIYYGNYAFALDDDFNLVNLYDPYCVISVLGKNQKEIGYILNSKNGMGFAYKEDSLIFRIGNLDVVLYSQHYEDQVYESLFEEGTPRVKNFSSFYRMNKVLNKQSFNYTRDYIFSASLPLFYYSRMKLREYVIKDLIVMLITIRDLLFPTVLTLSHDYAGTNAGFQVVNLVDQLESILNSYVDVGGIIGVKADLTRILSTLTYSIRILPDYKGFISQLNSLDTSKITEKIDKYKPDLETLADTILAEVGIPAESFRGGMTYWESMKQSERFASRVHAIINTIENSFRWLLETYLKRKHGIGDKINNFVTVKIFDTSMAQVTRSSNALENISSYVSGVFDFINSAIENLDNENINKEEAVSFIKTHLSYVVSNVDNLINWDKVLKSGEEDEEYDEDEEDDEDVFYYQAASEEEGEGGESEEASEEGEAETSEEGGEESEE